MHTTLNRCMALVLGILCVGSLCACSLSGRGITVSSNSTAFGTVLSLTVTGPTRADADETVSRLLAETARLERIFSYSDPDSELSRLNRTAQEGSVQVSEELFMVIERSLSVCERSGGALDIALGDLIELWHVETNEGEIPSVDEMMQNGRPSFRDIELSAEDRSVRYRKAGLKIHLGAVAKGYLCEVLRDLMKDRNCTGILNLGGSIQTVGLRTDGDRWRIGVADPDHPETSLTRFRIGEASVATSGSYQRYFEVDGVRYHHILDPKTGCPAQSGLASVTVTGPDGLLCDALSTACFVLGEDGAKDLMEFYPDYGILLISGSGQDRTVSADGPVETLP